MEAPPPEAGPAPPVPPDAPSGRSLLATLGVWLLLLLVVLGSTLVAARFGASAWSRDHLPDLVAIVTIEFYGALLAALAIAHGGVGRARRRLGLRFTSLSDLLGGEAVWAVCLVAGVLLSALLTPLLGPPRSNATELLRISFDPLFVVLIVPSVCLLAPLAEELLFRGALLGWLRTRLGAWPALPISAAVFAGAHFLPALFPVLFVFGLGTALVATRTGSTFNSFAMHATQNTLAVAATYVALSRGLA